MKILVNNSFANFILPNGKYFPFRGQIEILDKEYDSFMETPSFKRKIDSGVVKVIEVKKVEVKSHGKNKD